MSIENNLSKMSLYDAKKYFRKAQNVVFNYTEMEAKVREATNNEPWGASSTLMEQIAQGTYNYREREEILGMIFRRFTEKTASEWRQIYKALQLLEYLIKHGSERFIDDTRANLSLIKMLESFHYVDSQGRDQGINVRNRAKELVILLNDDNQIRSERKKARETAKKYKGVAGGAPSSYLPSSAINTSAGFGRSTKHGISVSADYDSDEENSNPNQGSSQAGYEDHQSKGGQDQELFSDSAAAASSKNTTSGGQQGEDDDDFADFQSAVPVADKPQSTSSVLADLYASGPQISTQSPATTVSAGTMPVFSSIPSSNSVSVPAVASKPAPKKDDPFSFLFSSAKNQPPASSIKNEVSAHAEAQKPNENDEEDDDGFGEMETAAPKSKISTSANNSHEVDLLSF